MTKKEILSELFYVLKMRDQAEIEVDGKYYALNKGNSKLAKQYSLVSPNSSERYGNAKELRQAVSKLGNNIVIL